MVKKSGSIFSFIVILMFLVAMAGASVEKYLPLYHFGIRVTEKNIYSKVGKTFSGTVTDPQKAYYGDVFTNANRGDRIRGTYMGNGKVKLMNTNTGEEVIIDVRVMDYE